MAAPAPTPTPTSTPTGPEPTPDATESRTRVRRRPFVVAGLVVAVGAAGLGVGIVVADDGEDGPFTRNERTIAEIAEEMGGLGDVTLDRLTDELADLGLEVRVTPSEPGIDALGDDEFDDAGGDDHDHVDAGDGDEAAATFAVDGDRISATSGATDAVAQGEAMWRRFVELIPADQRSMLIGFEVMAEPEGGGYVYPDESDPTKWIMGISPGLGADEDFVIIHEFAHLLTLQAEEVPPGLDDGRCPTYHTGEGCSLRGSTMAEFVARFWPRAQRDEVSAAQEAGDWDAIDAFYAEHGEDFVTGYATTNPAEDLAETFTVFVLDDRPSGDTIADQKVRFLWSDPDLVELRERIRAAM